MGILFNNVRNLWLKSFILSLDSILILEIFIKNVLGVLSYLNFVMRAISNYFQFIIEPCGKLKYHADAFPWNVYGKRWQTTSSCWIFCSLRDNMNLLTKFFGVSSFLFGSNFGRNFSRFLGKSCWTLGIETTSQANQGGLDLGGSKNA